ncbi:hypothetical protein [Bifidobacterium bombi]|nr:hypothetical protein [Bifidobacterium bombi]
MDDVMRSAAMVMAQGLTQRFVSGDGITPGFSIMFRSWRSEVS